MGEKQLCEPRGVSVTFGESVREGVRERQRVSCASDMQRGGWRSGKMDCGEQERNTCLCADSIEKEDDEAEKVSTIAQF